jgi:hypothetical protein
MGRASRPITLLTRTEGLPARVTHDLPLLVLELDGVGSLSIPAPALDMGLPELLLDDRSLHLQAPEGAALVAHLLRHGLVPAARGAEDPFASARRPGRGT